MQTTEWQEIVDALGTTVRDVRLLLGWSQQALADAAVVSQGTISRLERGECAAVPFHSVVVVLRTLAGGAAAMHMPLSSTMEQLLAFAPSLNGTFAAVTPPDPDLTFIAQGLRRVHRSRRPTFLRIVRELADALGTDGDDDG